LGLRLKNIGQIAVLALLILFVWSTNASRPTSFNKEVDLPAVEIFPVDSPEIDLPFPIADEVNPYGQNGRINLTDPSNVNNVIEYDPETGKYYFYQWSKL